MSFQEKSIAASLFTTLVVWGFYFYEMFQARMADDLTFASVKGLLIVAMLLTIVISVVVHSVVAAGSALTGEGDDLPPPHDERDRTISYKATHISSYLLGAGIVSTVLVAVFSNRLVPTVNTLLAFFVLSEILRYALQLLYYRRGV